MSRDIGPLRATREHDGRKWVVTHYLIAPENPDHESERIPQIADILKAVMERWGDTEHPLTAVTDDGTPTALIRERPDGDLILWLYQRDDGERLSVNKDYLDEIMERNAHYHPTLVQHGNKDGLIELRGGGVTLGWVMPSVVKGKP